MIDDYIKKDPYYTDERLPQTPILEHSSFGVASFQKLATLSLSFRRSLPSKLLAHQLNNMSGKSGQTASTTLLTTVDGNELRGKIRLIYRQAYGAQRAWAAAKSSPITAFSQEAFLKVGARFFAYPRHSRLSLVSLFEWTMSGKVGSIADHYSQRE